MELRKYSYERLDGSIRAEERFAAIRSFSGHSSKGSKADDQNNAFVFMISTRAGGVGLNLVAADTVSAVLSPTSRIAIFLIKLASERKQGFYCSNDPLYGFISFGRKKTL